MLLPTLAAWLLCLFPVISAQDIVASQSGHASAMISAVADMTPRLSKGAVITLPFQKRWAELQIRGSSPRVAPAYTAVVEVATEQDVATVVTIANRYNIPFLAVSGTHGWTKTLSNLPYGIQIRMRKLNSTTVSRDGNTAIVQGGVLQYEITRALFTQGKYAGKQTQIPHDTLLGMQLTSYQSLVLPNVSQYLVPFLEVGTVCFKDNTVTLWTTWSQHALSLPVGSSSPLQQRRTPICSGLCEVPATTSVS